MSKVSHTPGPWSVEPFNDYDKDIHIIGPGVIVDNDDVDHAEATANASLIAAAPDMLAALEECALQLQYLAEKFQPTGTGEAVYTRIQAAIAKATLTAGEGSK